MLTEKQEQVLIRYIQERRSGFMAALVAEIVASVFLAFPAYLEYKVLFGDWGTTGRGRMSMLPVWVIVTAVAVVTFFQGVGIKFGKGSDMDCVRNKKYTCTHRLCEKKSEDTKQYPYYFYDQRKSAWICPEFLEWRNAEPGCRLLCVRLENGKGYAFPVDAVEELQN